MLFCTFFKFIHLKSYQTPVTINFFMIFYNFKFSSIIFQSYSSLVKIPFALNQLYLLQSLVSLIVYNVVLYTLDQWFSTFWYSRTPGSLFYSFAYLLKQDCNTLRATIHQLVTSFMQIKYWNGFTLN